VRLAMSSTCLTPPSRVSLSSPLRLRRFLLLSTGGAVPQGAAPGRARGVFRQRRLVLLAPPGARLCRPLRVVDKNTHDREVFLSSVCSPFSQCGTFPPTLAPPVSPLPLLCPCPVPPLSLSLLCPCSVPAPSLLYLCLSSAPASPPAAGHGRRRPVHRLHGRQRRQDPAVHGASHLGAAHHRCLCPVPAVPEGVQQLPVRLVVCPYAGPAVKRACAGLPGDCSLCVCAVPWIVVCASRRGVAISSLVTKNVRVPLSPLSITFNDVHCISKLPPPPFMIKLRLTSYLMVLD